MLAGIGRRQAGQVDVFVREGPLFALRELGPHRCAIEAQPDVVVCIAKGITPGLLGLQQTKQCHRQPLPLIASGIGQPRLGFEPVAQLLEQHSLQASSHAAQVLIDQDQVVAGHKGTVDARGCKAGAMELGLQIAVQEALKHRLNGHQCTLAIGSGEGRLQLAALLGIAQQSARLIE